MLDAEWTEIKSPNNSHLFWIALGKEDQSLFENEMQEVITAINELIDNPVITNDEGIEYHVDVFLTCDMACLVYFLGLYSVFHPSSSFKCAWCLVKQDEIGNFTIPQWPLRDLQQQQDWGQEAQLSSNVSTFAQTHHGTINKPLLKLPWKK